MAQRQEFIRRFYGKSREEQEAAIADLLQYSMNIVDRPSQYRGNTISENNWEVIGAESTEDEASSSAPETTAPATEETVDTASEKLEAKDDKDDKDDKKEKQDTKDTVDTESKKLEAKDDKEKRQETKDTEQ